MELQSIKQSERSLDYRLLADDNGIDIRGRLTRYRDTFIQYLYWYASLRINRITLLGFSHNSSVSLLGQIGSLSSGLRC
jgi:hypothetical protein